MTKEEILAVAGYPNTEDGIAAFYNEYNTPEKFFAKHGGSLSGAPYNGQPTADQFFDYGSHANDQLNIPMSNPYYLQDGGSIVNYLASKNQNFSKEARKKLAEEMGIQGYDFSAEKNTELLNLLKSKEGAPAKESKSKPVVTKKASSENKDKMKQFLSKTQTKSKTASKPAAQSYSLMKDSKTPKVIKQGEKKPTVVKNYNVNADYNIPSETTRVKGPLLKLPSKKEQANAPAINTDAISANGKMLPQSGVVVDKRNNQAYYFGDQGQTGTFPVLTGKNPNLNKNAYTMGELEANPMLRNTPAGYYMMDVPSIDKPGAKKNKDYYNYLMKDYAGKVRSINPISAFGVPAPIAQDLAFHRSYSDNSANPNDPEFKRREALYSKDPKMRCTSYGCVNVQDASYDEIYKAFPTKDTLLILDPKNEDDLRLLNIAKKRIKQKEEGGAYFGGPTRPYEYGGDMLEMLHGGYHSPMNYGSFPAIEWGGALDTSNQNAFPMMEGGGDPSFIFKKLEAGKTDLPYMTDKDTRFYESNFNFRQLPAERPVMPDMNVQDAPMSRPGFNYRNLPAQNPDMPFMNTPDTKLADFIKSAARSMKKKTGGKTTTQGANQNHLEELNNRFRSFIQNNVYNDMLKKEEQAAMQAINPYAMMGMQDENEDYVEARYGLSVYKDKGEKQPENPQIPWGDFMHKVFNPNAYYATRHLNGAIKSRYEPKDLKTYEENLRGLLSSPFTPTRWSEELKYGPLARMLGKTGQRIFGPKNIIHTVEGTHSTQVPIKDTDLNLPGFEKQRQQSGAPSQLMNDYYNQGTTESEDIAGISTNKLPEEKIPQYKYRNLNLPAAYNEDGYGTEYEDRANYSDQYIQKESPLPQNISKNQEYLFPNAGKATPAFLQNLSEREPDLPNFFKSGNRKSMQDAMDNSQIRDQGIKPEYKKNDYGYTLDDYLKDKMRYEATSGSASGTGFSDFGYHSSQIPLKKQSKDYKFKQPSIAKSIKDKQGNVIGYEPTDEELQQAVDLFKSEVVPQINYFGEDPAFIGRASDLYYNAGRDPRVYMMDQYLKSQGKEGLPNRGKYNKDVKKADFTPELEAELSKQWNTYQPEISKLPREKQIELLDQGREYYYKNTYTADTPGVTYWSRSKEQKPGSVYDNQTGYWYHRGPDGSLSPAYGKTWKGRIEGDKKYKKYGGILNKYQGGGLSQEDYDKLMQMYKSAEQASQTSKKNQQTFDFQQAFHDNPQTRKIAEQLLQQRQAANNPTAYGKTLGAGNEYSLKSNEDRYFGDTTKQYLAGLQTLKPQSSTSYLKPGQTQMADMDVPDTNISDLSFNKPVSTTPNLASSAATNPVKINNLAGDKPKMGNETALDTGLSDAAKKKAIVDKAKGFPTGKLTPDKPELKDLTETETTPGSYTFEQKRKVDWKGIREKLPMAADFMAGILEKKPDEPGQLEPAKMTRRGQYQTNVGVGADYKPDEYVTGIRTEGSGAFGTGTGAAIKKNNRYSFISKYGGALPQALSGLEVKMQPGLYGTNGNRQFSLPTQIDSQKYAQQPTEVRNTLLPVAREGANLEAEKGETALVNIDGIPAHFKIGGKRHSEGGTPLNLPDNSFIFSDTASMKIKDPYILAQFGMAPKKSGYTPAEIAKKYDINKYRKILSDPNSEDLERKTAERMIANCNMKLAKLALIQESMKGFPQGFPVAAMPYLTENNIQPNDFLPAQEQGQEDMADEDMGVSRYGGNIIAQFKKYGGLTEYQTRGQVQEELNRMHRNEADIERRVQQARKEKQLAEGYKNVKSGVQATLDAYKQRRAEAEYRAKNPTGIDKFIQYFDTDVLSDLLPWDFNPGSASKKAELNAKLRQLGKVENLNEDIALQEKLLNKITTPGYTLSRSDFMQMGVPGYENLQGYGYTVPGTPAKKSVVNKPAVKKTEAKKQQVVTTAPKNTIKDIEVVKSKPAAKVKTQAQTDEPDFDNMSVEEIDAWIEQNSK